MAKTYRSQIYINGKEIKSPRFERKSDADAWFSMMKQKKQFMKDGLVAPLNQKTTLDDYVNGVWLPQRKKEHSKATWGSDEQRYRDYVSPKIGFLKMAKIHQLHVRTMLKSVTDEHNLSPQTRNKVRSLISKIFNDSMNEELPLRADNPALNISFSGQRVGKKKPRHLKKESDILLFIKTAKSLSIKHYIYACTLIMAGLRKQEMIPLRWNDFSKETSDLEIDEKYIQAENRIVKGTKSGTEEVRAVPIPDILVKILSDYKKVTEFNSSDDFILCDDNGNHLSPRNIAYMNEDIAKASGIDINPHGLRHTYGRQFAAKNGNMAALKAILGHSNMQTTELYSELAGRTVSKHRNTVSFDLDGDEND